MGKHPSKDEVGEVSHFRALTASLSGTIGLGNIAGVAVAIQLGGPGAIFWMWVTAVFGIATKFLLQLYQFYIGKLGLMVSLMQALCISSKMVSQNICFHWLIFCICRCYSWVACFPSQSGCSTYK